MYRLCKNHTNMQWLCNDNIVLLVYEYIKVHIYHDWSGILAQQQRCIECFKEPIQNSIVERSAALRRNISDLDTAATLKSVLL